MPMRQKYPYLATAIAWVVLVSCGSPEMAVDTKPAAVSPSAVAAVDVKPAATAPVLAVAVDTKPAAVGPPAVAADGIEDTAPSQDTFSSGGPGPEGETSLKERIAGNGIIVRASVTSVSGAADTLKLKYTSPAFGAHIDFHLRVHEYLKGSGPDNLIAVFWHGGHFGTREEAQAYLPTLLANRNAEWEDRQAIIFLSDSSSVMVRTERSGYYYLASMSFGDDMYSLDSVHDKQWLPGAAVPGSGGAARSAGTLEFLLADPGEGGAARSGGASSTSASTVTLGALKELITAIDARMQGSERHKQCVRDTYEEERLARHFQDNTLSYETYPTHTFASDQAKDAVVWQDSRGVGYLPDGPKAQVWLDGGDSGLFAVTVGPETRFDKDGDGTDDRVRFDRHAVATRPLPAGEYRFQFNERGAYYVICEGWVFRYEWTVTVTAPNGVAHEAFFDPVTVGTSVKADGTNGQLSPASFTDANSASATLQSISYEPPAGSDAGTVKLQVDPHTGLAGHRLDFIELDGSVSLSLDADAATVDAPNKTLSWLVTSQPWDDGDKLMLRIAEVEAGIALLNVPSTISHGQVETFTVRASGLAPTSTYKVVLTTDNGHLGFLSTCSQTEHRREVSGSRTSSFDMNIQGCTVGSGTLTASLLEGSAPVGTAVAEVEVEASTRVRLTLSPREERLGPYTDISIEWTDPDRCEGRYFVGLFRSNEVVYRDFGYHPAPATTSLEVETGLSWEWVQTLDGFVRVSCHPGSGSWVVGQATLQSGLPSTPSSE